MKKFDEFFVKNKAEFKIGAVRVTDIPLTHISEIAFVGRSNVGKSSLINAILNQKIAVTSKTPGRTRQLNFFNIADKINFVDMPGYGYAKAPKKEVKNWNDLIFKYLQGRPNLKRLFLLIDGRREIGDNDIEVMKTLNKIGVSYQIVLTKSDQVKKQELEKAIQSIENISTEHVAMFSEILVSSAEKGYGISELRSVIYDLI